MVLLKQKPQWLDGRYADHGKRASKFALVGVLNTGVDLVVYSGLIFASLHPVPANVVSFLVANLQSYFVNARFTFGANGKSAPLSLLGYGKYFASHSFSLIVSTLLIAVLAPRIGPIGAKLIAAVLVVGFNYVISSAFVFPGVGSPVQSDAKNGETAPPGEV
jgi:putative flippase GtrA